jgi:hypothetical protein
MSIDPASAKLSSRPKWRWVRFNLRTLLAIVTIAGLLFGLKIGPAIQQKRAIEALKGDGFFLTCQYDYEVAFRENNLRKGLPPEPTRLAKIIGVDFFHDVTKVQLSGKGNYNYPDKGFNSEDLKRALSELKNLPRLRFLDICAMSTALDDQDLSSLASLSQLEELCLYECHLGDVALRYVRDLHRLKKLILDTNRFSDDGVANLQNLTNVTDLDLGENQITDAGLAYLANMVQMKQLVLIKNRIAGEGLKNLAGMKELRELYLDKNPIIDEGLEGIENLPRLETLSLAGTNVTDACIESLATLHLWSINVFDTKITQAGLKKLHELFPEASIQIKGGGFNDHSGADPEYYMPPSN